MQSRMFLVLPIALMALAVFAAAALAGDLNPPGAPAPTMKTLDQIPPTWDQTLPANDGTAPDSCNSSRFKCVMGNQAVLDKETGLVWERTPGASLATWTVAITTCLQRSNGGRMG